MRLAPVTLRERKMRSGMSGLRAVPRAPRTPPATPATPPRAASVLPGAPAVFGGGLDDRVDAQHQRACDEHRAGDIGALGEADPPFAIEQAHSESDRGDADGDVDEEDPVPVDRLGEHPAGKQPHGAARGGHEGVDADRLGLLARLGEHRDDHAEHHRRGHAPPMPCRKRAATSSVCVQASPHSSEEAVKRPTPTRNTRERPKRSPKRPASSSRPPKAIR